jgi:hypothetical protein
MRRRHHYGTTGNRLHLDVRACFKTKANLFELDPRVYEIPPLLTTQAIMGDIVQTDDQAVDLSIEAVTHTPIERIEVLNGIETVKTVRGYGTGDLGNRIRVVWSGANCRGRGRKTQWIGKVLLKGARITRFEKINAWNSQQLFEQSSDREIVWSNITTGNFVGFDIWLDQVKNGQLVLRTNHTSATMPIEKIGLEDHVFQAGGLGRKIKIFRMPDTNRVYELHDKVTIPLRPKGDNPLWVRVTTDDGYNAWSSPIYVYREQKPSSVNKGKSELS